MHIWMMAFNALFGFGLVNFVFCENMDISAMFPDILQSEHEAFHEPCDDISDQTEFDFIVVGAGASGCAVANRLSEVNNWEVLLLEAGGEETTIMDIPNINSGLMQENFWIYKTLRSETGYKSFIDQQTNYLTGKTMGGGTSVNWMMAVRGSRYAYDEWESLGNPGWSYEDVLPYFKKLENIQIPELRNSEYHSTEGNVKISYTPYKSELTSLFLQAGEKLGYSVVDYNGENMTGVALVQTTTANGSRWSASHAYLHPIRDRPNFHVKKRAMAMEILINQTTNTAYGVFYTKNGRNFTARARKEVIISAGAIKSAQLLMVSGIGPRQVLEEHGIDVIKDSNVGLNSIDHPFFFGLIFTIDEKIEPTREETISNVNYYFDYFVNKNGPLTNNLYIDALWYMDLEDAPGYFPGWPSLGTAIASPPIVGDLDTALRLGYTSEMINEYFTPLFNLSTYQFVPFTLKPKSRGRIILQNKDMSTPPVYDANIFSEEEDIEVMIAGIREIIKLSQTPQFQCLGAKLYDVPVPACKEIQFNSDEYWRCAMIQMSFPGYHASGTCKMGPASDRSAVVDSECKVHGVNNLRVSDTSIFPTMPSSNPSIPAYMIGEKVADMIKKDHPA